MPTVTTCWKWVQFHPWDAIKSASLSLYIVLEIIYENIHMSFQECTKSFTGKFTRFMIQSEKKEKNRFRFDHRKLHFTSYHSSFVFNTFFPIFLVFSSRKFSFIGTMFEPFKEKVFNHIKKIFTQVCPFMCSTERSPTHNQNKLQFVVVFGFWEKIEKWYEYHFVID